MITALALALSLMLADAPQAEAPQAGPPQASAGGEPLPPGAPTDSYQLSAWCYGALDEYLAVYEKVKPDLRDIDHMFGTSVVENDPYHSDMDAARVELKMIADSVTQAEKASPRPISDQGLAAIQQGRAIWSVAETKTSRELARAWLSWALPDRCDSNARELTQRSILFGKALNYNNAPTPPPQTDPAPSTPPPTPADQGPPPADMVPPAPPAPEPAAQAVPTADTSVPMAPAADAILNAPAPAEPAPRQPPPSTPTPTATDPAIPPYPTQPATPSDQPAPAATPQP
jgi:hypothetical protein